MNIFSEPKVPKVSVDDVQKAIQTKESCVILDVRTPGEYARGKIEGSVNVPVDTVSRDIQHVIADTSAKVYVYCFSGSRSAHAVETMISLGYTNVFDMTQGLLAWRAHQYPLVP